METNEPDWGFDWPPKQRIVPSEVIELEKSSAESKAQARASQQMSDNPLLELVTRPVAVAAAGASTTAATDF